MKYICVSFFLLLMLQGKSQKIVNAVLVGNNGITENVDSAKYLVIIKKYSDSSFERIEYNFAGPRLRSVFYKDPELKVKNDTYMEYDGGGEISRQGKYANNVKTGEWFLYEKGSAKFKQVYKNGQLISVTDLDSLRAATAHEDSLKNAKRKENESEFEGGMSAYMKFLNKNFKYPERAIKLNKQGTVFVVFVVDTLGAVIDPLITKSVEFSMDEEALRIVSIMPKWSPAVQDGRKVKSFKKQPITFRLEGE
jgi:protein TonB